jgi:hypothetical protein
MLESTFVQQWETASFVEAPPGVRKTYSVYDDVKIANKIWKHIRLTYEYDETTEMPEDMRVADTDIFVRAEGQFMVTLSFDVFHSAESVSSPDDFLASIRAVTENPVVAEKPPAAPEPVYGTWSDDGSTFENPWAGYGFVVPDGWIADKNADLQYDFAFLNVYGNYGIAASLDCVADPLGTIYDAQSYYGFITTQFLIPIGYTEVETFEKTIGGAVFYGGTCAINTGGSMLYMDTYVRKIEGSRTFLSIIAAYGNEIQKDERNAFIASIYAV